jgi:hypothetical protein
VTTEPSSTGPTRDQRQCSSAIHSGAPAAVDEPVVVATTAAVSRRSQSAAASAFTQRPVVIHGGESGDPVSTTAAGREPMQEGERRPKTLRPGQMRMSVAVVGSPGE